MPLIISILDAARTDGKCRGGVRRNHETWGSEEKCKTWEFNMEFSSGEMVKGEGLTRENDENRWFNNRHK